MVVIEHNPFAAVGALDQNTDLDSKPVCGLTCVTREHRAADSQLEKQKEKHSQTEAVCLLVFVLWLSTSEVLSLIGWWLIEAQTS